MNAPLTVAHAKSCSWIHAGGEQASECECGALQERDAAIFFQLEQLERARFARLEEAQRHACYAEAYRVLALYHAIHEHPAQRVLSCSADAERCHRFAVALVFGPWPELT